MASLVTNAGFANFSAAIVAANLARYLQWGVGSGQAATDNTVNDTTGTTEARTAGALSQVTTTVANDTVQCVGTITAAGARAITEVGVFDAAGTGSPPTGGNMDIYGDFGVINLNAADSITFTVKVKFS
jgi:hypothetical protein